MNILKVLRYKAYVWTSAASSNSKALGALVDFGKRRRGDGLRASQAFFAAHEARAARVASLLADEESRAAYRALIQYRCSRERRWVNPHMRKKQTAYLDQTLIVPGESEVFVDAGAFQGLSSLRFQALCLAAGRPAPRCVIFEPDPFNFSRLQKNLPKFQQPPVCYQMGLGRERGQCGFQADKLSMSKIEPSGGGTIQVDTLDHVLEALPGLQPTYLKIDVEGADLDLLYGAQETIWACRPRIAVAIYHNDEHMIRIPEAIHEIRPDYRLYVRHYSCLEGETILYCL